MFGRKKREDNVELNQPSQIPQIKQMPQALSPSMMRQLDQNPRPQPIAPVEKSMEEQVLDALNLHGKYIISFDERITAIESFIESHRKI